MPTAETAADLRGPYGGATNKDLTREIAVITTTGSTQQIDLSTSTYFNGSHYQDKFVRIIADVLIYYYWSNNNSGTLDETAAGASGQTSQCDMLPANTPREECPAGQYFIVKGAAGKVRICITNQVSR